MTALVVIALLYAAFGVAVIRKARAQDKLLADAAVLENPAVVPGKLSSLRQHASFWVPFLRGKVSSLHVVSAPIFTVGGAEYGANGYVTRYQCLLVDTNGETHEIAHAKDERVFEDDAKWLAQQLGLELDWRC